VVLPPTPLSPPPPSLPQRAAEGYDRLASELKRGSRIGGSLKKLSKPDFLLAAKSALFLGRCLRLPESLGFGLVL